jgi:spermidine synthase
MSGCSNLFPREFFVQAEKHLKPGGIMCQWIHLYQISVNYIRIFLGTYQSVFPNVLLWIDKTDMLALGSAVPIVVDPAKIQQQLKGSHVKDQLRASNLDRLENLLPLLAADSGMVRKFAGNALQNVDDHPILEFSAPKSILEIHANEIIQGLAKSRN